MIAAWELSAAGVVRLPSGRLVRGRGLRHPLPAGPEPTYGLYLLGQQPPTVAWEVRWVRWPDFGLPSDRADAASPGAGTPPAGHVDSQKNPRLRAMPKTS